MKASKKLLILITVIMVTAAWPALAEDLVNMEFKQAPLVDVFQILGQLGGYNVLVDPTVQGEISFALNDLTVEEALDLVTRTTGYRYKLLGNTLVVSSDQRLKTEFGDQDFTFVPINYVDPNAAQRLLSLVVPAVKSYVDQDLGLLVIYGLTTDLETAKKILSQYDQEAYVPLTIPELGADEVAPAVRERPVEIPVTQHMITVRYGDDIRILEALQRFWPERQFRLDAATQTILGVTTAEEWAAVLKLVWEQDLPKFQLKGILGSADQLMVLVEYRGVTSLLKPGDLLVDWELSSIEDGEARFQLGDRSFTVRMGR